MKQELYDKWDIEYIPTAIKEAYEEYKKEEGGENDSR